MRRALAAWLALCGWAVSASAGKPGRLQPQFQTSDRCMACHNGLVTPSGQDVSIGFHWRAGIMANSSRDPYWQAGVRREVLDHPAARAEIEDECSKCHMPIMRYEAHVNGKKGRVFANLPFGSGDPESIKAEDGVSCSVCHQISRENLGKPESLVGGFVVEPPDETGTRAEYGPYAVEKGHQRIMLSSSEGYRPTASDHIRSSELCATCHTLYTHALGPNGEDLGRFPEQVPFQEWQHSEYKDRQSCQSCHMPEIAEPTPITRVLGQPREGARRHSFVAGNFFLLRVLNRYRDELGVAALPDELTAAADETVRFLAERAARITIGEVTVADGRLRTALTVDNLGGHKLPTAYPSRRAWLHVRVLDGARRVVFESGALKPDGSIEGNDNDADAGRFEPHYSEIREPGQVQIYEPILGAQDGTVTTGLLNAVRYLKDNRILPRGFDKVTAHPDIAVHGAAADDPNFGAGRDTVRYSVALGEARGPYTVEAELWYQPIGFRWANNLKRYAKAAEPARFAGYYDAMGGATGTVLARASR